MIRPVGADGRIETGGAFTPIHRSRLVQRIAAAAEQRIVLIVAPAGYGKSVALTQYLESAGDPYVRYDVHAEHAALLGFVRGFTDALVDLAPNARKALSGAYERSRSSRTPGEDLALWLHAHVKTFSGIIAIDDLHIAESDPEVAKFLVSLIERTKGRARWVIASRSTLDLPVGSWLAYGESGLHVDEEDLRFLIDEARQAAKAARVGVRDEELAEILSMTQGWPTALSFALRSSTRSVDLRNIAASTREMIYRYLAEQVYSSLSGEERDLLHVISYLPAIDIEVLRHAGYDRAKGLVEALRARVAFIYAERPGIYRCHDLFRDFLRFQLEVEGDAAVQATAMRAARALEEAQQAYAALKIYAQIGSDPDLLRLLESHGFALTDQAHGDAVTAAVDALSPQARRSNAIVLGLRAQREYECGRFDLAEPLFHRAIEGASNPVQAADLAIRLALVLVNQGREAFDTLQPATQANLPESTQASALALVAVAYARAGRTQESQEAVERADRLAGAIESDELRAKIYLRIGMASLSLNAPADVVTSFFRRAHRLAGESALYGIAAYALSGLASVALFYEDDLAKTIWYAQQSLSEALKAGDRFSMQTALLQMINVEARRGNAECLESLHEQFARSATTDAARMSYVMPARAMAMAWRGSYDEAYRLMGLGDPGFYVFDRAFNLTMLGLFAIACGDRARAIDLAEQALAAIDESKPSCLYGDRLVEIARSICACVETLAGRLTNANRILQHPGGTSSPGVEAVREAAFALWRLAKRPAAREELDHAVEGIEAAGWGGLGRVLAGAVDLALDRQDEQETLSPLTRAEYEVLQLLAEGRGPKDIAQESGRSVYTVQAHIRNVIKKLGCSGRHEALTLARKRGLLA